MPAITETEVLARLAQWDGLVIVDFDETLYLRNSTEDFITAAGPAYLAAVLLRLLDFCAPWRWGGGEALRDWWRVRAVLLLFPWTRRRWERQCREAGPADLNAPLLQALRGKEVVVASIGFAAIIQPLMTGMGCAAIRLIACGQSHTDRRDGKLALIQAALGSEALASAMVITDSPADAELLERCAQPCLTQWRAAKFQRAFAGIYLPGDYLAFVKRPQEAALRRLVVEDLALWLLASLTAYPPAFFHLAGVVLLFLSLWSVYEIGYFENDVCAAALEDDPVVSAAFAGFEGGNFERKAWASALGFGLPGLLVLAPAYPLAAAAAWLAVLLGLRAVFYVYNRIDKSTRVWLYPVLQFFRSLAFALVVPVGVVGILACLAQIISRWQGYFVYRHVRALGVFTWQQTPARAAQLVVFLLGLCGVALATGGGRMPAWPTAALLTWSALLARKEIATLYKAAQILKSRGPGPPGPGGSRAEPSP